MMLGDWELAAANSAGMLEYAKAHTGSRYRQRDETLAGLRAVEAAVRADERKTQIKKDARVAERRYPLGSPVLGDAPSKIANAIRAQLEGTDHE